MDVRIQSASSIRWSASKNRPTWMPSQKAWCAVTESGIVTRPPSRAYFPQVMWGTASSRSKLPACETDVKSTHGRQER